MLQHHTKIFLGGPLSGTTPVLWAPKGGDYFATVTHGKAVYFCSQICETSGSRVMVFVHMDKLDAIVRHTIGLASMLMQTIRAYDDPFVGLNRFLNETGILSNVSMAPEEAEPMNSLVQRMQSNSKLCQRREKSLQGGGVK